ncbi:hypothetical protein BDZ45DRAFT_748622 [Acephala macrosclerotiorum]|nr:hypothetical protein BDZ45DRAFT_748622 [Acephala macrosclerotiorum]
MAEVLSRLHACPLCSDQRHRCIRDANNLQCRNCRPYIRQGMLQDGSIHNAELFYEAAAHAELFQTILRDFVPTSMHTLNSLPTLDIDIGSQERNALTLQITNSAGETSEAYAHDIDAPFNTLNTKLVLWLDGLVQQKFTLTLQGRGPYTVAIEDAILAGGYIHFLCSSSQDIEEIHTTRDNNPIPNQFTHYNLHIHFRFLVLSRLRELLERTLATIRFEDPENEFPEYTRASYAAAFVLRREVDYFMKNLRNGPLSLHARIPPAWKGPGGTLVEWFANIDAELQQRLRHGCGIQVNWDSALSALRNARRRFDTFQLKLTLHQIKYSMPTSQPTAPIYTPFGDGEVCLTSPPISPTIKVLWPSDDTLDEEDLIPAHVSYLALLDFESTGAETSVMDLDLFPGLALIR